MLVTSFNEFLMLQHIYPHFYASVIFFVIFAALLLLKLFKYWCVKMSRANAVVL